MARLLVLGTSIKVDDDDSGTVFTTVTLLVRGTPPPRLREVIVSPVLGDTLETAVLGIEKLSKVEFEVYSQPNDTQHVLLRTLWTAKTQCFWNITYSNATVEQFDAVIESIVPNGLVIDGLVGEVITIIRQAAIAYT